MRAFARFVASVLMVSGVLLIGDAGATLLWQEPVSYASSRFQQNELKLALDKPPARVRERKPLRGDAIGRIEIPSLNDDFYLVEGTDGADLRRGPGHYPDTPLPGERGTVGVAGHRTTHGAPFRNVDKLKRGQKIILDMTYGRYTYTVEKTRIVAPTELSVLDKVGYDRLILSACHPLYSAAQRIIVFAKLTGKGEPRVKKKGDT